jgi:cell shape-determining protein MreD
MRWIPFVILAWVMVLLQTTFARLLTTDAFAVGTVGPDLLASLAVFAALYAQRPRDALVAAWVLGMALDLATAGGPGGGSLVGPMSLGYVLGAKVVYSVREAFFRDRLAARALMCLLFCLIAHCFWVTAQSVLSWGRTPWGAYRGMLVQAGLVSVCSALLAPVLVAVFAAARRRLMIVRTQTDR